MPVLLMCTNPMPGHVTIDLPPTPICLAAVTLVLLLKGIEEKLSLDLQIKHGPQSKVYGEMHS